MKRRLGKERLFTPEERGARAIGTVPTGCPSYQARREPTAAKPTVFLQDCPDYDVETVKKWVGEQNAYTRPEVMEGVLRALKERDGGMTELVVGERCGITIPSRYACEHSGFDAMLERVGGVKRSLSMLKRKLTGKPYQRPGTTERGDGEPEV